MSSASDDGGNGDERLSQNGSAAEDLNDEMDELFDDAVDDEAEARVNRRELDDDELDSGDDLGRRDRAHEEDDAASVEPIKEEINAAEIDTGRHPVPVSTDGEGYVLKVPQFLSIDPVSFSLQGFQPPSTDHHSTIASNGFSAHKTAQTTIRWRHSPSKPSELQSNARILRWSDGSLTLQLASDPTVQYEMGYRALAPPQRKPKKPTPLSKPGQRLKDWSEKQEQFTFLAAASQETFTLRTTNKITASLQVNTVGDNEDEALERLQSRMAAARGPGGFVNISTNTDDPEKTRREAEQAERDALKAQRRLESQQNRERDRGTRGFGRSGGRGPGLSIGGLEEEGTGRRAPKKVPKRRRNDEYSDEEEQFGSGYRGAQDEYDEDDAFIAKSDEDDDLDAEGEDDEDADDMDAMIERREREQQAEKGSTPKRTRQVDNEEEENDDAEADEDEEVNGSPVNRSKRRRVVDDDDDSDE